MIFKRLFALLFLVLNYTVVLLSQNGGTMHPIVDSKNNSNNIEMIIMTAEKTTVLIELSLNYSSFRPVMINSGTYISYKDPQTGRSGIARARSLYTVSNNSGSQVRRAMNFGDRYDVEFWAAMRTTDFAVEFDPIPCGVNCISIIDPSKKGVTWNGIHVNPRYIEPNVSCLFSNQSELEEAIVKSHDKSYHSGFYEEIAEDANGYRLAFVNVKDKWYLIYQDSSKKLENWKLGEIKAELRSTVSPDVFTADWYMVNKRKEHAVIVFSDGLMKVRIDNTEEDQIYILMNNGTNANENAVGRPGASWSGSGIMIGKNYIVTNYHVVEGASEISVYGINGDNTTSYKATVKGVDKQNDLAIIAFENPNLNNARVSFGVITATANLGEEIMVLGYPMTDTMGEDIKLTTGVVSSKSGFQGDVSLYQISAPIQPGNSGGPMFDKKGNLLGIVCAKHRDAENASYAIKTSCLQNLVESSIEGFALPTRTSIGSLSVTEQVKQLSKYVVLIKCHK